MDIGYKVMEQLTAEEQQEVEAYSVVREERDRLKKDNAELVKGVI